jgi:hypothetical protein
VPEQGQHPGDVAGRPVDDGGGVVIPGLRQAGQVVAPLGQQIAGRGLDVRAAQAHAQHELGRGAPGLGQHVGGQVLVTALLMSLTTSRITQGIRPCLSQRRISMITKGLLLPAVLNPSRSWNLLTWQFGSLVATGWAGVSGRLPVQVRRRRRACRAIRA